jgi:hypothetical protein
MSGLFTLEGFAAAFRLWCPKCGGRALALAETGGEFKQSVSAGCRTPLVARMDWRCNGCNSRYSHWFFGWARGVQAYRTRCAGCGREDTIADRLRDCVRVAVPFLPLGLSIWLGRPAIIESPVPRYLVLCGLWAVAAVLWFFLVFRRWGLCPDFLVVRPAGPAPDEGVQKQRRAWGGIVRVQSLEEEYRYIQFNLFPCACRRRTRRKVERHGTDFSPAWLGRLGLFFLPCFRVYDTIHVCCPTCGGRHTYWFDASAVPHIQRGLKGGRFLINAVALLIGHMGAVVDWKKHRGDDEFHGLSL